MEVLDERIGVLDPRREVATVPGHERVEVVGRIGPAGVLEEHIEVATISRTPARSSGVIRSTPSFRPWK